MSLESELEKNLKNVFHVELSPPGSCWPKTLFFALRNFFHYFILLWNILSSIPDLCSIFTINYFIFLNV